MIETERVSRDGASCIFQGFVMFLMGFKWTVLHWGKAWHWMAAEAMLDEHTNTQTHTYEAVNLDIALGLIMNTSTAKYLTPRLLVDAANNQPTHPDSDGHGSV